MMSEIGQAVLGGAPVSIFSVELVRTSGMKKRPLPGLNENCIAARVSETGKWPQIMGFPVQKFYMSHVESRSS